jgi:hypothetical protein
MPTGLPRASSRSVPSSSGSPSATRPAFDLRPDRFAGQLAERLQELFAVAGDLAHRDKTRRASPVAGERACPPVTVEVRLRLVEQVELGLMAGAASRCPRTGDAGGGRGDPALERRLFGDDLQRLLLTRCELLSERDQRGARDPCATFWIVRASASTALPIFRVRIRSATAAGLRGGGLVRAPRRSRAALRRATATATTRPSPRARPGGACAARRQAGV